VVRVRVFRETQRKVMFDQIEDWAAAAVLTGTGEVICGRWENSAVGLRRSPAQAQELSLGRTYGSPR
jgi:hypothetical protein